MSISPSRLTRVLAVSTLFGFGSAVHASGCEVVTDPALDQVPSVDIVSAELFTQGTKIGARITMTSMAAPTVDTGFWVHWVDSNGAGYYIGGYSLGTAGNEAPAGMTTDVGTYNPATGEYTWYGEGAFDAGIAELNGDTVTVVVDPSFVGNPAGELTGIGALSGEALTYVPFDTTTNDGTWTYGEDCSKAGERSSEVSQAGAGTFGGLALLIALAGFGRRRRG